MTREQINKWVLHWTGRAVLYYLAFAAVRLGFNTAWAFACLTPWIAEGLLLFGAMIAAENKAPGLTREQLFIQQMDCWFAEDLAETDKFIDSIDQELNPPKPEVEETTDLEYYEWSTENISRALTRYNTHMRKSKYQ